MSDNFENNFKEEDTGDEITFDEQPEEKQELTPKVKEVDEVKEKPKKKKREMTPERKKQLLENLAKGRLKSQENRKKRGEYNKLMKEKQRQEERQKIDDVLEEDYKKRNKKNEKSNENQRLNKELEELRDKLKFFTDKKEEPKKMESLKEEPKEEDLDFLETPIEKPKEPIKPKPVFSGRIKMGSRWK